MSRSVGVVVELPAVTTEVAETAEVAAEIRTRLAVAAVAHRVLEVGVDLNLDTRTNGTCSMSRTSNIMLIIYYKSPLKDCSHQP